MVTTLIPRGPRGSHLFDLVCREMDDFVGRFHDQSTGDGTKWFSPRTDVEESDNGFNITMDLPGLTTDDFNIELKDGDLTITGKRERETEENGSTYHRLERVSGQFRRSYSLGPEVDAERVEAQYKDGVLRISVPKAEKVQPKKIEVTS